jgi:membrane protein
MNTPSIFRILNRWIVRVIPGVFRDTFAQMQEAQLLTVASSLAYTTLLSIIPVLAVSFAIFKAFGGVQKLYDVLEPLVLSHLAEGSGEDLVQILHSFIDKIHTGAVGLGGLIGLIITTMSMLFSAEKAINGVWKTPFNQRSVFHRVAAYWLFITLGPLGVAVAVGVATSANFPLWKYLPSGTGLFLLTIFFFFLLYKYVPETKVKWQYALISGSITAVFWNVARMGYAIYTKQLVTYHAVYGSLAAVPILMIWVYIMWIIVLTGASLTAALQKRAESAIAADK